ncbi:hypothetical protein [Legionella israelensis]|uniref:Uncharacterized protein n=1 Tax=Legionella israelensis TaxID=454 RepID=A0A0W0VIS5_9GAMM|nr:hypothetical protein [Legionella israelensis]KTD20018.1 hypothetical protein Lisr_1868 [Legionella israelensis]QBS10360.1 hypothetical protein E4T55_11090 [Legionella israelensis]SCY45126.1 hypothetical protein SAMN02746069_02497 [Legionella israelensis DSM 19235]STX59964.1 Uncharacterised protein [Legionella israelensis]
MKKNYIRSSIIVLIQTILPIIALLIITPWFINSQTFNYLQDYLKANQPWFLIWHGLFYLGLFFIWPILIKKISQHHQLTGSQLKKISQSRWYLIITFILIDVLMLWS